MTEKRLSLLLEREAKRLLDDQRGDKKAVNPNSFVSTPKEMADRKRPIKLRSNTIHYRSFVRGGLFVLNLLKAEQKRRKLTE